jgi:hypothetical protein
MALADSTEYTIAALETLKQDWLAQLLEAVNGLDRLADDAVLALPVAKDVARMIDVTIHLSMVSTWACLTQDDGSVIAVFISRGDTVRFIGTPNEVRHLYETLILAEDDRRHPKPLDPRNPPVCWTGD